MKKAGKEVNKKRLAKPGSIVYFESADRPMRSGFGKHLFAGSGFCGLVPPFQSGLFENGKDMEVKKSVLLKKSRDGSVAPATKGQMEAEISSALISFEKEHMGRGPVEAKTYIIQDIVVIRLKGILTPAEIHLAKDMEGIQLIKQVRSKLLENAQDMIGRIIHDLTGVSPVSMHTDISTKTGERFIIVTLAHPIQGSV